MRGVDGGHAIESITGTIELCSMPTLGAMEPRRDPTEGARRSSPDKRPIDFVERTRDLISRLLGVNGLVGQAGILIQPNRVRMRVQYAIDCLEAACQIAPGRIALERISASPPGGAAAEAFGRALAATHDAGAAAFGAPPDGWAGPLFIGRLPQPAAHDATVIERERQIAHARETHQVQLYPAMKPRLEYVLSGEKPPAPNAPSHPESNEPPPAGPDIKTLNE